jgi:DNA polymerase-1
MTQHVALIIDGPHMTRRHYHVTEKLTNAEGNATGGIFGFLSEVCLLARELEPDLIIAVWDHGSDPWRLKLHSGYRDRRDPNPVKEAERKRHGLAVDWQVGQLVNRVCPIVGVPCLRVPQMEADDIVYLLARHILPPATKKLIVSGDKDFLQLVSDDIWVVNPGKKKQAGDPVGLIIRPDNFGELYDGLTPQQYLEGRLMTGDDSDHIDGIHGIGDKTAAKIIKRFGGLLEALERPDEVTKMGKVASRIVSDEGLIAIEKAQQLMNLSQRPTSPEEIGRIRALLTQSRSKLGFHQAELDNYCLEQDALHFQAEAGHWILAMQAYFDRSRLYRV